jgi:arginyl-tRNA synthetase
MFEKEINRLQNLIMSVCQTYELPDVEVKMTSIPFSGEWGVATSFFAMAAAEARSGKKVVVPKRAQEIAELVAANLTLPAGFTRVEAVRGYLNIYFDTNNFTQKVIATVFEEEENFGRLPETGKKILVEFSQPNTHKSFHVGHLRNMILGGAVCNILDWAGNDVIRANYIGDIGLHVIKWLWNYLRHHQGEEPDDEPVKWLGNIYAEAARYFEDDPSVEPEVRELFSRWHHGDKELAELWKKTRDWSLDAFLALYDQIGIHFDHIYFESEVEHSGIELVDELIEKGIARDERPEESVIVPLDEILGLEEQYRVLVVLRSDGTSLYSTKDLALAIKKFDDFHPDQSVYIIDVRQSLYMQQIFKTLELMGHKDMADRCYHLPYEIVNLPGNVTMSSREGTVVLLEDLINEATDRAYDVVTEKTPELSEGTRKDIASAVALGSIKYTMLSKDNKKIVTFDWEKALDFNGQAAPYIQYAYVRAGSILRKAGERIPDLPGNIPPMHAAEIQLIELMTKVPAMLKKSAEEMQPLHIASLTYDLAKGFNDFYNQCPVLKVEGDIRAFRLNLVKAARQTIANCLAVLGIIAPEAM